MQQTSATKELCANLFTEEKRTEYAAKCVPTEYRNIACPVIRALTGSGFLEWLNGGTPLEALMETFKNVLGVGEDLLPLLRGQAAKASNTEGNVELLKLIEHLGSHAASSGIIGAATNGEVSDKIDFNPGRFDTLLGFAKNEQFTPEQFGKAVNHFASERFNNRFGESLTDVQWEKSPFSWVALTFEYSNVFNAFKNSNFKLTGISFLEKRRTEIFEYSAGRSVSTCQSVSTSKLVTRISVCQFLSHVNNIAT
jgi:hypothetical protein